MDTEKIALFDMDGTLVDYDGQLLRSLEAIRSPHEPHPDELYDEMPEWMEQRRQMITSQVGWWKRLPIFGLGWEVLEACKSIGFSISVLTKGPSRKCQAWAEKVEWCNEHLKGYIDGVTITQDKGLVYGRVLVDDYPEYIERWLRWRPRLGYHAGSQQEFALST